MGGPSQKGTLAQSCPIVQSGKSSTKPLGAGFGSMGFFYKVASLKFLLPKPGMSTPTEREPALCGSLTLFLKC